MFSYSIELHVLYTSIYIHTYWVFGIYSLASNCRAKRKSFSIFFCLFLYFYIHYCFYFLLTKELIVLHLRNVAFEFPKLKIKNRNEKWFGFVLQNIIIKCEFFLFLYAIKRMNFLIDCAAWPKTYLFIPYGMKNIFR